MHVWKAKKGYLKIHFGLDIRTKHVVSIELSSERIDDGKLSKRLVNRAKSKRASG